jgi:hypothetical protein
MAAITSGEILFKYSVAAAAGNTTASSANASLGDQISTTAWAGGSLNDLFDDISGAENAASTVDYRGIFVHNSNSANVLENPVSTSPPRPPAAPPWPWRSTPWRRPRSARARRR